MTNKQYGGITRDELDRLRADLAAEGVVVPEGDDVTFDATHRILLRAVYDEAKETLSISIVKKPFYIPESQVWGVLDTGIQPYVGGTKMAAAPVVKQSTDSLVSTGNETYHKHRLFRFAAKQHLRRHGYTSDQANRMVGALGDGKILAFIEKWGPTIIKILMMILPLFMQQEAPKGKPVKGANDFIDENEVAD